ncbi:MAG TPA: outer membrane beta-barrel protein [Usitatibacter sp.]|nr:outer membrane beta-barrel protein [Usitatibacter sp.]
MGKPGIAAMAAAIALSCPGIAAAQGNWYAGATLGQSRTSDDLVSNRESTVVNGSVTGSTFDAKDTAVRLFGGYRLAPWLSLEANYTDLGTAHLVTGTVANDPPIPGTFSESRSVTGFGAGLVLSAPVLDRGSVFARVSAQRARTQADATLDGNIVFTTGNSGDRHRSASVNQTIATYALGGEWMLNSALGLRLEWERWQKVGRAFAVGASGTTGEADIDFYSVGLLYRF